MKEDHVGKRILVLFFQNHLPRIFALELGDFSLNLAAILESWLEKDPREQSTPNLYYESKALQVGKMFLRESKCGSQLVSAPFH